MSRRITFYFMSLLIVLAVTPTREVFAQKCIGATAYVVRDERGQIMRPAEMEKLSVTIDGVATKLRKDPGNTAAPHYYEAELTVYFNKLRRQTVNVMSMTNPLVFGTFSPINPCGKLGDLTLGYGGKQMRLIFDTREHNTYFEIDSLPFQEGTFHLRSLRCKGGERPPLIDNATTGKCVVTADNWEGMEKGWVRYLIPNDGTAAGPAPGEDCHGRPIGVISTQADWAAAAERHPELRAFIVDFAAEVVLVIYTPMAAYTDESFVVDKKGDLTFHPPDNLKSNPLPVTRLDGGRTCIMFVVIYRSGVKSVEGRPLPPPSGI